MKFEYQTDRLYLRILPSEYAHHIHEFYINNKTFLEPLEPKRPDNFYTLDFQKGNLNAEYQAFLKLKHIRYWLFAKENGTIPIGSVCFSHIMQGAFKKCMLGYKLAEDSCHHGFMTEALSFLVPETMHELGLHRVEAYVQPENLSSVELLTRLHFKEEGYLSSFAEINGNWADHLLFSYVEAPAQYIF